MTKTKGQENTQELRLILLKYFMFFFYFFGNLPEFFEGGGSRGIESWLIASFRAHVNRPIARRHHHHHHTLYHDSLTTRGL